MLTVSELVVLIVKPMELVETAEINF